MELSRQAAIGVYHGLLMLLYRNKVLKDMMSMSSFYGMMSVLQSSLWWAMCSLDAIGFTLLIEN